MDVGVECGAESWRDEEVEIMEKLLDVEVTRHGTILEELETICCMTGLRLRLLVEHIGEELFAPSIRGQGSETRDWL